MLKVICSALIEVGIEWQYDKHEMKLKCRTKVNDDKLFEDDKFIEDYIRKEFLKFYVYINKIVKTSPNPSSNSKSRKQNPNKDNASNDSKNSCQTQEANGYILNVYLKNGTVPIFIELTDQLFSIIKYQMSL